MSITRKEIPDSEIEWYYGDFPLSYYSGLFDTIRWEDYVEWDVLLNQANKIDSIVLLIDKHSYHSKLFLSYLDILEANLYIFDDLFFFLIGARIGNEPDIEKFLTGKARQEIYNRLFFWGLDWHNSMMKINEKLQTIRDHIICFLNQRDFAAIRSRVAEEWSQGFYLKSPKTDTLDIVFPGDRAHRYANKAYAEKMLLKPLVGQILNILNLLGNAIIVFDDNYKLPTNCFPYLLEQFRISEKGQELIKAWERDFAGSRDSLLTKMEKLPELCPWVHRYQHFQDDDDVIEKLFYDERHWVADEKEYYNTKNWISILEIATILQEYDERQNNQTNDSSITINKSPEELINKLVPLFNGEEEAKKFPTRIKGLDDKKITILVNQLWLKDVIADTTTKQDLWQVLHDAGLYTKGISTWNGQVNKPPKRKTKTS